MDPYHTHYTGLHFERAELFKLTFKRYQCKEVLYPGCSLHITPSLFFPHVVYVDKSEAAARFFADEKTISTYVNRHKHYQRSAYLRFIRQDYLKSLPLLEAKFDLLLALFAGGISRSCKGYLKRGGLLISNNHQNDAMDALRDEELGLISAIKVQGGKYVISESGTDATRIPVHTSYKNSLRHIHANVEYIEKETYYVFERKFA